MRLRRRLPPPRTTSIAPAERYLLAGGDDAGLLGHTTIGTEHVLARITRDPDSRLATVLRRLGVTYAGLRVFACVAPTPAPPPEATFGPGALEPIHAGSPALMPRLEVALACALDRAGDGPLEDVHVLVGLLGVRDSLAAHLLSERGVSIKAVQEAARAE